MSDVHASRYRDARPGHRLCLSRALGNEVGFHSRRPIPPADVLSSALPQLPLGRTALPGKTSKQQRRPTRIYCIHPRSRDLRLSVRDQSVCCVSCCPPKNLDSQSPPFLIVRLLPADIINSSHLPGEIVLSGRTRLRLGCSSWPSMATALSSFLDNQSRL